MTKILVVEPYYGGSHKLFVDGLRKFVAADYTLLSLPARKWKMRMQLAAPWFIEKLAELEPAARFFDIVLFSSFIDVAVFKALTSRLGGWNSRCRYLTYFHENQFAYPNVLALHTSHQFTSINFSSALVSDSISFNSEFNRDSFFSHCRAYLDKAVDMDLESELDPLHRKSRVLYPGIDFSGIDETLRPETANEAPLIIWNHRWEHDKNPEEFFKIMLALHDEDIDFRLCVLGQRFRSQPVCFHEAQAKLGSKITHFGYVEDQAGYHRLLAAGDVVVSTTRHEFFGISVLEAVRAGCLPVLPDRLAYPELFSAEFIYEQGGLHEHLKTVLLKRKTLQPELARRLTEPYAWQNLSKAYQDWLS